MELYHQDVRCLMLFLIIISFAAASKFECPCENEAHCQHPKEDLGTVSEVFIFSNGTTDVDVWKWDTLTTLVGPSSFDIKNEEQAKTMCTAHSNGRKFSITVAMTLKNPLNVTSDAADKWMKTAYKVVREWFADILTVDLLHYFAENIDSSTQDLTALAQILVQVKQDMEKLWHVPFKMACIVPWKPPCASDDILSCDFASLSNDACDYYVINPDSFIDGDNQKCVARATIPMSKLLYGISEYNVHHVPRGKMILGIPWHGYSYECDSVVNDVCKLQKSDDGACDFSRRTPIAYKDIVQDHITISNNDKTWFSAPSYTATKDSKQHQVWYEDKYSLTIKYRLVSEMKLKGVGLMFGDDLATSMTAQDLINDALMWSFVAHEFLLETASTPTPTHHDLHYADNMAGVAVGCLLLGTALGTILTCVALRSRIRRPKRPFLSRHDDSLADEFIDETDDRHL